MQQVTRPEATGKKISCKDEFELCYIRHKYFRKVNFNPTDIEMKPYYSVIKHFAKKTFFTYMGLFQQVGMDNDDIVNIGKVHLVSYLGLFSIDKVSDKHDKFLDVFYDQNGRYPEPSDILSKDRACFSIFLKQRMEDLVRICRQKIRNIKGVLAEEYLVFCGPKLPTVPHHELPKVYESLGYKKIDIAIFKAIKRKIRDQDGPIFQFNGLFYITVPLDHRNLTIEDFQGAGLDPYDSVHNMNPEQLLIYADKEQRFAAYEEKWHLMSAEQQNRKIRKFISANKNNPIYTKEVKIAKFVLKKNKKWMKTDPR